MWSVGVVTTSRDQGLRQIKGCELTKMENAKIFSPTKLKISI